jgi:dTDP-4-dehydrorhamnose 3,5-epimerase
MPFEFSKAPLEGLVIVQARRFGDSRGFFMETYKHSDFERAGIGAAFVQDNHSRSTKGVLRGLHYQTGAKAQGKLVRVVYGSVWDVAVDLRKGSPTYAKWWALELNEENDRMLFIPPGFAHGFLTLSEEAHLVYKCSAEYDKASEGGVIWNDSTLAIEWPSRDVLVSEKDAALPALGEAK